MEQEQGGGGLADSVAQQIDVASKKTYAVLTSPDVFTLSRQPNQRLIDFGKMDMELVERINDVVGRYPMRDMVISDLQDVSDFKAEEMEERVEEEQGAFHPSAQGAPDDSCELLNPRYRFTIGTYNLLGETLDGRHNCASFLQQIFEIDCKAANMDVPSFCVSKNFEGAQNRLAEFVAKEHPEAEEPGYFEKGGKWKLARDLVAGMLPSGKRKRL